MKNLKICEAGPSLFLLLGGVARSWPRESTIAKVPNSITVTIVSGPFFTCQVRGTAVGTYLEVSLIVIYEFNEEHYYYASV